MNGKHDDVTSFVAGKSNALNYDVFLKEQIFIRRDGINPNNSI